MFFYALLFVPGPVLLCKADLSTQLQEGTRYISAVKVFVEFRRRSDSSLMNQNKVLQQKVLLVDPLLDQSDRNRGNQGSVRFCLACMDPPAGLPAPVLPALLAAHYLDQMCSVNHNRADRDHIHLK